MFIEFQLPQDSVQGSVRAFDEDGNEVNVSRIVYTPFFFKPSSIPTVLFASLFKGKPEDTQEGNTKASQRAVLTVSGSKAAMRFQDRTEHVTPLCEEPKKEPKKEAASVATARKSRSS